MNKLHGYFSFAALLPSFPNKNVSWRPFEDPLVFTVSADKGLLKSFQVF